MDKKLSLDSNLNPSTTSSDDKTIEIVGSLENSQKTNMNENNQQKNISNVNLPKNIYKLVNTKYIPNIQQQQQQQQNKSLMRFKINSSNEGKEKIIEKKTQTTQPISLPLPYLTLPKSLIVSQVISDNKQKVSLPVKPATISRPLSTTQTQTTSPSNVNNQIRLNKIDIQDLKLINPLKPVITESTNIKLNEIKANITKNLIPATKLSSVRIVRTNNNISNTINSSNNESNTKLNGSVLISKTIIRPKETIKNVKPALTISNTMSTITNTSTTNSVTITNAKPLHTIAKLNIKPPTITESKIAHIDTNIIKMISTSNSSEDVKIDPVDNSTSESQTKILNKGNDKNILEDKKIFKISDLVKTDRMINLQISNGVLSDPNGPIKLLKMIKPLKRKKRKQIQKIKIDKKTGKITLPVVLKHKKILDLQSSPRQRSKSLTSDNDKKSMDNVKSRRLSFPLSNDSEVILNNDSKSSSVEDLKSENNNSLYCNENLDSVSEIQSTSESKNDSTSSSTSASSVQELDGDKTLENSSKVDDDDDKNKSDIQNEEKTVLNENEIQQVMSNIKSEHIAKYDDPMEEINWKDGIGYLKDSQLHFQFNEFGLIEILDDISYEKAMEQHKKCIGMKPLSERFKNDNLFNGKQSPTNEVVYKCKNCLSYGVAKDFETPDYCSTKCLSSNSKSNMKMNLNKNSSSRESSDEKESANVSINLKKRRKHIINEFSWDRYLYHKPGIPANKRLFYNPFPSSYLPNRFMIGHKLEAIDPENSSIISVATVVKKCGYRVKISFDGYPNPYDFWANVDSLDLLPAGFCRKTGKKLHTPPNYKKEFIWEQYLIDTKSQAAPRGCFQINSLTFINPFKIGMKLEADDLRNSEKVCVATVRDVIATRILIHFDGWDDMYDYWTSITSPYIHPINWHKQNGFSLTAPPEKNSIPGKNEFSWKEYLAKTNSIPAPRQLFSERKPLEFKVGMKLEAVDKRVPSLIRPGTIVAIDEYEIKVHFDGWPEIYAIWFKDDSPDIHPIKWCSRTGHPIEIPPDYYELEGLPIPRTLCGFIGCRGVGNAFIINENYHSKLSECPYERKNYLKTKKIVNRLEYYTTSDDKKSPQKVTVMKRQNESTVRNNMKLNSPTTSFKLMKLEKKIDASQNRMRNVLRMQQQQLDMLDYINSESTIQSRSPSPPPVSLSNKFNYLPNSTSMLKQTPEQLETLKRIKISKALLTDYGPRLEQVHRLWQKNTRQVHLISNSEFKKNSDNPMEWDIDTVANCVNSLPNCTDLGELFKENEIDGVAFLCVSQNDLQKNLNLKLGPAVIIYNQIVYLREEYTIKYNQ